MSGSLGMVLAMVALSSLVFIHECGHYVVARWCRIRVEQLRFGVGPALLARTSRKTTTTFELALIPIGGSVRIRGMRTPEDVDPADRDAFSNRPVWQRLATILAGSATNFLVASALAMAIYTCHGVDAPAGYGVAEVLPGYDAIGKLERGDGILAVDHNPLYLDRGPTLSERVNASAGAPVVLTIERNGQTRDVQIAPRADDADGRGRWRLGVRPAVRYRATELGTLEATWRSLTYPFATTVQIVQGLYRIAVGTDEAEVAGPVRMVEEVSRALAYSWVSFLQLIMVLSVYYALFQLLPFGRLDGMALVSLIRRIVKS